MELTPSGLRYQRQVTSWFLLRLWMIVKLPSALFCGLGVSRMDPKGCVTYVPYGWRSQNPFRSTYFAAQAMAAELSTGALILFATANAEVPFSTLIVDMKATFGKKAVSTAFFTCECGDAVFAAVAEARATGEPRTIVMETVGRMADGTEVSRFWFTWSVKARRG